MIKEFDVPDFTERFIRTEADKKAIENGCRFDIKKASWFIYWCERYLTLYQGEKANTPYVFHTCSDQPETVRLKKGESFLDDEFKENYPFTVPYKWEWNTSKDFRQLFIDRFNYHCDTWDSGKFCDWTFDFHARLYGWIKYSNHYSKWVRRHTKAIVFVGKKNKKSPTMAANSLYLTCADSEAGNQVFCFARELEQAKAIVGEHVEAMIQSNELLDDMFEVKHAPTLTIKHVKSRSVIKPASARDKRSTDTKHGYNGSIMVDESHSIPKELDSIVKYAGASRSQAVYLNASTAGFEIDCWGKDEFDLGLDICEGENTTEHVLAVIYAAPQTVKNKAIEKNFLKYAKMANPAIGHTINVEELEREYNLAKSNPVTLNDFKVTRLNIWQQTQLAAFSYEKWKELQRQYIWDEFFGARCWLGFDRSLVSDLTALAYLFEKDGNLYVFVDHWLPQATSDEQTKAPYQIWSDEGWLNLVNGQTIDDDDILPIFKLASQAFSLDHLQYDPSRCGYLIKDIQKEMSLNVEPFQQTAKTYHQAVEEFDSRIKNGTIFHRGNPLLNWQIKNCKQFKDNYNYRKLVKPKSGWQKIDGATAIVMAIRGWLDTHGEKQVSTSEMYSNPDLWKKFRTFG